MGRIKEHFVEHKELYIGFGVGVAIAGVGVVIYLATRQSNIPRISSGRDTLINSTIVGFIENSTPSKPVHLVGTDLYFNSLGDAARKTGHPLSQISKNVNGHIADIGGDVFELLQAA